MNIQEIYKESNQWLKDLEFLEVERRFLKKIITDHLTNSGHLSSVTVNKLNTSLFNLEVNIHSLRDDILANQTDTELTIKGLITKGKEQIKTNREQLFQRFNELFSSFREFKQELFKITNEIIEEESLD